jgi:hypothetical protein
MAINPAYLTPEQFGHLIAANRGWFIFEGVVFVIIGIAAIGFPFIASIAATIFLGALLLIGGIATAIRAFGAKDAPYRGSSIALAILTIITGLLLLIFVPAGLLALTLSLAAFFIVRRVRNHLRRTGQGPSRPRLADRERDRRLSRRRAAVAGLAVDSDLGNRHTDRHQLHLHGDSPACTGKPLHGNWGEN